MRRALRGVLGVVLAAGAVLPVRSAWAQPAGQRLWYQPQITQKAPVENVAVGQEGSLRFEEMKVELALLADIGTFPYSLNAHAVGQTLALRGYVPNYMIRQRALEVARHSTFLAVRDELKIQPNLSPAQHALQVLQQEGMELLHKKLGPAARQISLSARPNGIVVLTGRIDSVESKVEVSRLLRQLSGCFGVFNELTVEQTLRDGQRVVQVTHDGSAVVSPAALGLAPEPVAVPRPQPKPVVAVAPVVPPPEPQEDKKPAAPPQPKSALLPPQPSHSFDAREGELRLPTVSSTKTGANKGTSLEALIPAKVPSKWQQPTPQSPAKKPPSWVASPTPSPALACAPPTKAANEQAKATAKQGTQLETLTREKIPSKWGQPSLRWEAHEKQQPAPTASPTPSLATTRPLVAAPNRPRTAPISVPPPVEKPSEDTTPSMTWHRPSTSEESEPKTPEPARPTARVATPSPSKPPLQPSLRWPPAYESYSPERDGRPGTITFDDAPPPQTPAAAKGVPPAVAPDRLQRQVQSVCGRQAQQILVEPQRDGTLFVKVKVANLSASDQLSQKILAIPEMTAPKVRLIMDVGP